MRRGIMFMVYLVEVKEKNEWKSITEIPIKYFEKSPDVGFLVNSKQKEEILEYENKPLRLIRMIVDSNENVVGYEVKLFNVWDYHDNKILCLDPNRNYRESMLPPSD